MVVGTAVLLVETKQTAKERIASIQVKQAARGEDYLDDDADLDCRRSPCICICIFICFCIFICICICVHSDFIRLLPIDDDADLLVGNLLIIYRCGDHCEWNGRPDLGFGRGYVRVCLMDL